MLMSRVIGALAALALVFGALSGSLTAVSNGLVEGAAGAVSLMLSIGGTVCLWSGLMEVMARSGLADRVARLLRPLILLLFGRAGRDREARGLQQLAEQEGRPPDEVMLLIVLNTASLQLIPTTIAAVRAGLGAARPCDTLPAVWLASGISVAVGILACGLLRKGWRS